MKKKNKLNWRQKWCDDRSGYWYSAKVPVVNWEYIIDVYEVPQEFTASVYYSSYADNTTPIINKSYKTKEAAMNACEKHLDNLLLKFKTLLKS